MKKVFISHASPDKELVGEFVDLLNTGANIMPDDIFCSSVPGMGIPNHSDFGEKIKTNLQDAQLVIILLTKSYLRSPYCNCELGATWYGSKSSYVFVVPPLRLDEVKGVMIGKQVGLITNSAVLDELKDVAMTHLGISTQTSRWNEKKSKFLRYIENYVNSPLLDLTQNTYTLTDKTLACSFDVALYSLKQFFPLLYWIDTVVPGEYAGTYFERMQDAFHNGNTVLQGTDENLIFVVDTLLRVLSHIQEQEDYCISKLRASYNSLRQYLTEHGETIPEYLPGEILDIANEMRGAIEYGKVKNYTTVKLDQYALLLIQGLGACLAEMSRDRLYRNIEQNIQNPLRKYLEVGLLQNHNLSLPEIHAIDEIRRLKSICEDSWKNSLKCRRLDGFKDKY